MGLRILLLTTDAYGGHGGIALYNRDIVDALAAMPDVAEIVVIPRTMPLEPVGIPGKVRFIAGAVGRKWRFVGAALAAAASQPFDLVICGHIHLLSLAGLVNLKLRAPLVLMAYGIDVWQPPSRWARQWLPAVHAIWSISAITTERMNQWARLPATRYVQLPNAIHLDRYGMAPRRTDLQARHGLVGARVIMTLARLPEKERYKGIDEVLKTFPALLQDIPNLKYLVAGDGNDRARLEQKARTMGIAEHIIFAGMIPEADKADYFRLADAFVMPGRGEGFGFVFLEALACGVPVVGSQLDGSREALRDGLLGELANPADLDSVRACILRALATPHGIPPGLSYFDWPHFKARLVAALRNLLNSPETSP